MNSHAPIWVVAGPPGGGKSTVADMLLSMLSPTPALLDKDTLYSRFVTAILTASDRLVGEREGPWYDEHIKVHEYAGLTDTAREISAKGCPVLLSAPFTHQIHDLAAWNEWVEQLGGEPVRLVWVKSDAETLKHNILERKSERDAMKLANFQEFIKYMQIDKEPVAPHITVDNRLSARDSLREQLQRLVTHF